MSVELLLNCTSVIRSNRYSSNNDVDCVVELALYKGFNELERIIEKERFSNDHKVPVPPFADGYIREKL